MKRIDRYIGRQYLVNIAVLFLLLLSLVVAIDVVLNLGRFLESGAKRAGPEAGMVRRFAVTAVWIVDLWGPRLLQLFNYLSGVVLVAAMGFTCAALVRRRELVAALASGLSLQRLALPMILVGLLLTGFQALNQEVFLPAVAPLLTRDMNDALRREVKPFDVPLAKDGANRLWYAVRFDAKSGTLTTVHIWERDADGRATGRIGAESATWDGSGWRLTNARYAGEEGRAAPERIQTDLDPTALVVRRFEGYGHNLSWRQISAMMEGAPMDDATRERFDRIRYGRVASMAGNMLALVIAMPFFLVREPKNMVGQVVKCAPIAGTAFLAATLGPAMALPGLPAAIGVFVPVMVLAPIALAAAVSVKT